MCSFVSVLNNSFHSSDSCIERIAVDAESNGRIKSVVPNNHHVSVVSELVCYSLP